MDGNQQENTMKENQMNNEIEQVVEEVELQDAQVDLQGETQYIIINNIEEGQEPPAKKLKNDENLENDESATDTDDDNDRVYSKTQVEEFLASLKVNTFVNSSELYNASGHLIGLYLNSEKMDKSLLAWPDVIYIWTIQGWIRENFTAVIFSIKDSNFDDDIISVGLSADDDNDSLSWLFKTFKDKIDEKNIHVKYIFGEKHLVDTHLKQLFPDTHTFVPLHSSLILFERILDSEAFVTSKKEQCMLYFQKMVHAKSLSEYKSCYTIFFKMAPLSMVHYFDEDWDLNKQDWTLFSMIKPGSLLDDKTEHLDKKIKAAILKGTFLFSFVIRLFKLDDSFKQEFKFKASTSFLKKNDAVSPVEKYSMHLTSYAFHFVNRQIILSKDIKIVNKIDENSSVTLEGSTSVPASVKSCECKDWVSMMLPCRHIFAVRKSNQKDIFCADLCNERWTRKFYIENRLDPVEIEELNPLNTFSTPIAENSNRAVIITNKLLDVLCSFSGKELNDKLNLLEDLANQWGKGRTVKITPVPFHAQNPIPEKVMYHTINLKPVEKTKSTIKRIEKLPTKKLEDPKIKNQQMTRKIMKIDLSQYGKPNTPLKFSLKPMQEQVKMILSWITKKGKEFPTNRLINVEDLETDTKSIQHSILNEAVNLDLIQTRLTREAFETIRSVISEKRETEFWLCFVCEAQLEDNCVLCASCLLWFHPKCVGIANPQKRKVWFCYDCSQSCEGKK